MRELEKGIKKRELEKMKVETGQIWVDNSTGTEVEILRASLNSPLIELQEVGKIKSEGYINYVDLYKYFTFVRWKE